jgi:hypothetical protein
MFMLPMPPEVSGPAVCDVPDCGVVLFVGVFIGIDMSILCSGDGEACGVGEAAGICIPGMFPIPGFASDDEGVGVGECDGMGIPFMSMPCVSRLGAGRGLLLRRAVVLAFDPVFRFVFALAFGLLPISMPGMCCMLCP